MAKPLVDDELWKLAEPILPAPKPRRFRFPGRKPITNRQALTGILFVLKTGIPVHGGKKQARIPRIKPKPVASII